MIQINKIINASNRTHMSILYTVSLLNCFVVAEYKEKIVLKAHI